MFKHIFRREITSLFRTPFAWVILSVSTALIAFQFLSQIEFYYSLSDKLKSLESPPGVSELVVLPLINFCALLLIFMVPIVTMQTIANEKRHGTLQLVLSSPVNLIAYVFGKFFSVLVIFGLLWVISATMVLSLEWGTHLDLGLCASALLGIGLFSMMAVSVGLLTSALFSQPPAAGAASLVLLLFLWFCDWVANTGVEENLFSHLSAGKHYQNIANGLFDTFDIAYFIICTSLALSLTHWRINQEMR